jgi:hypothetical protein
MVFRLLASQFRVSVSPSFRAANDIVAANVLRGAIGTVLRREFCGPGCQVLKGCADSDPCPYHRIFEPGWTGGPSGLRQPPKPFVLRPDTRPLSHSRIFFLGLNVFDLVGGSMPILIEALKKISRERPDGGIERVETLLDGPGNGLVEISLAPWTAAPDRIVVEFQTPVELKAGGRITGAAEFGVLMGRIKDRISALQSRYGGGELSIDHRRFASEADRVRVVKNSLHPGDSAYRRSGRTMQVHRLGGLTGAVEYEGDLRPFLPFLEAARWTGVGRHTVWGQGVISWSPRNECPIRP